MEKRKLGTQGLVVSAIGLGCMGMSQAYGTPDETESIATLNRAIELGIDFFDTADVYGNHHNEELVGKTLKPFRSRIQIATKFGNVFADGKRSVNGRPEYVRSACDGSLSRLGVDHIDLYYQHRVDRNVPIEETVGAMAELVRAGKVRYLGLSEASAATIRRAHKVHPDHRGAVGIFAMDARLRGRRDSDPARTWNWVRSFQSAGARNAERDDPLDRRVRRRRHARAALAPVRARELRAQSRCHRSAETNRRREADHAEPARARMGARAGQ